MGVALLRERPPFAMTKEIAQKLCDVLDGLRTLAIYNPIRNLDGDSWAKWQLLKTDCEEAIDVIKEEYNLDIWELDGTEEG